MNYYTRHAGPNSAFRSALKLGETLTRKPSSIFMTVLLVGLSSLRWTSVAPGWERKTSFMRSIIGGVHLAMGEKQSVDHDVLAINLEVINPKP